jgi:hypothetical protein
MRTGISRISLIWAWALIVADVIESIHELIGSSQGDEWRRATRGPCSNSPNISIARQSRDESRSSIRSGKTTLRDDWCSARKRNSDFDGMEGVDVHQQATTLVRLALGHLIQLCFCPLLAEAGVIARTTACIDREDQDF